MKTHLLIAVMLFLAVPCQGAERVHPVSTITAVTVFTDRAAVTRTVTAPLGRGRSTVVVDNLPVSMQDDSLRVASRGGVKGVITSVDIRSAFLDRPADERIRRIEEDLGEAVSRGEAVAGRIRSLASQRAFVESIKVGYAERVSRDLGVSLPAPDSLGRMLSFVGASLEEIAGREREAEKERREIAARIDALKRELARLRDAAARESKRGEIAVEAEEAGTAVFEVSYVVPQAGWEPAYDIRLNPDGKSVDFSYRGLVRQKTGEDWRNVSLALSTARPALGGAPPELYPWHLYFHEPRDFKALMAPAAPEAAMRAQADAPAGMRQVEGAVEEGRTSVSFEIPGNATVPSDGFPHGVLVARRTLPAQLEYVTVPKLAPYAYLRATVQEGSPLPVLAGNGSLFVEDTFTGNRFVPEAAAGEKLELYLGTDEGIRVRRVETKRKREGGLLSGSRITYRYRIEVANHKKVPAAVEVRDQLPLPGNEEIKISLIEASPQPARDAETGELVWKLDLPAGDKRDVVFEFRVDYPKDRKLGGI